MKTFLLFVFGCLLSFVLGVSAVVYCPAVQSALNVCVCRGCFECKCTCNGDCKCCPGCCKDEECKCGKNCRCCPHCRGHKKPCCKE